MDTKYIDVTKKQEEEQLKEVGIALRTGKLAVIPTETVYGLAANALDEKAVDAIYGAKGRENDNPLIVHIAETSMLFDLVKEVNQIEEKLISHFWPGPLTIIFPKKEIIPNNVTARLDTVAIREPKHEIARKIIAYSGVPIAAPSANISGRPSGTNIQDIKEELMGKVDYIVDSRYV